MFIRTCILCNDKKKVKSQLAAERKYCNSCKYKDDNRSNRISKNKSGENHHFFGNNLTEEHKQKISQGNKGKKISKETRRKISVSRTGNVLPTRKGVKLSEEIKTKIRLGGIEAYRKKHGSLPNPRVNYEACKLFDQLETRFDLDGIYASKSGSEFFIKELGYWVDYYEPNLNIVIEFYEKEHNRPQRRKKDKIREDLIKKHLGCKFIVIWEFDSEQEIHNIVYEHIHNK